ncbi:hypothetical protein TGPRC2_423000 [Toxoplasma gondii TgCatPRC2]|uniref:Uncharacterized protein n=1 Tax=Toxoplasma gondii TgCatPRC2 TaxID=1130821 RepID=A0A151HRG6_TOXGO|nr:hypothetical protein TGPRC2_423000 [Toxoplasma gondii TgCatPRC2]
MTASQRTRSGSLADSNPPLDTCTSLFSPAYRCAHAHTDCSSHVGTGAAILRAKFSETDNGRPVKGVHERISNCLVSVPLHSLFFEKLGSALPRVFARRDSYENRKVKVTSGLEEKCCPAAWTARNGEAVDPVTCVSGCALHLTCLLSKGQR